MVKVKAKCPRCKNAFEHEVDLSEVIEREAMKKAQNLAPSSKMSPELKKQFKEEAKNEVKLDHANELQLEKQKRKRIEDKALNLEQTVKKITKPINQGSPELDGEGQEIVLENYLKDRFPSDKIIPVPKGKKGADCIQEVRKNEKVYGRILWESKKTKFLSLFVPKLLQNMERENIGFGIIATKNVPGNFKGDMEFRENNRIIICKFDKTLDIVSDLVREYAVTTSRAKNISKNTNKDQQKLWEIFMSDKFAINFINLVKSIKEDTNQLNDDIEDQNKSNKKRRKNIIKKKEYFQKMIQQFSSVEGPLSQKLIEVKDFTNEDS